ncbi:MAG: hypothetical protein L3J29_02100 [Cyclobacteriaceae bacterium]|nr:hypothetical protein [Cyclobacteriaceae bacterium]
MATKTINISKQATGTGLYLTDNEGHAGDGTITTIVREGDTVVWQLKPKGGITEITNIYPKTGSENIFSNPPIQQPDGSWKGTVANSISGSESYSIDYNIGKDSYTDDPEILVDDD